MAFKLPRLNQAIPIVNPVTGNPTPGFLRFWDEFAGSIEQTVTDIQTTQVGLVSAIQQIQAAMGIAQAAQQAANDAQQAADDAAGGTAVSGSATNPAVDLTGTGWVLGPQVDLAGVVAGNLTITGTGPQQDSDVILSGPADGETVLFEFRVVEIVLGVDEVLFTGPFSAFRAGGGLGTSVSNDSAPGVAAFTSARASTGAVSYRIDARQTDAARNLSSLLLYIFARRA